MCEALGPIPQHHKKRTGGKKDKKKKYIAANTVVVTHMCDTTARGYNKTAPLGLRLNSFH